MIRTINEEGIGITDFEAKMKASKAAWVARILRDKGNLGSLMQAWLNSYNMNYLYLIQTNITKPSDFDIKQLPLFHKEVICAFNECKCKKNLSKTALLQQNIWFNKSICYKSNPIFFPIWCKSGYKFVKELFNDNGFKIIEEIKRQLVSRKNYLCEYTMLKSVFKKIVVNFKELSNNSQTNLSNNLKFYFKENLQDILDKKITVFLPHHTVKQISKTINATILVKKI